MAISNSSLLRFENYVRQAAPCYGARRRLETGSGTWKNLRTYKAGHGKL